MTTRTERELFAAALDVPPERRNAWLQSACPDEALRRRVQVLLAAHESAPASALERQPEEIGPYRLLEHIGGGAMGDVYLAEQTAPVVRRVAIKIVKQGMDTREYLARFELERQALAMMSHPGIARIHDAGATSLGRPYIVMEYVPGVPITRYCADGGVPLDERLGLFAQVCDAVNHAHQRGIIHRDLKPSNILVAEIDGAPAARIIDFGIAKTLTQAAPSTGAHTRIGNLIGTPEYMSPEQAMLSPLALDTRTDVFSLGVILYELLTGTLPRAIDAATPPAEISRQMTEQEPPPPSSRAGPDARAVRGELDWIAQKALQTDRGRRYATVAELAADIRRYLANEPVLARPPTGLYLLSKFISRHKVGTAVAVSLLLSFFVFHVFISLQSRELERQRDAARFEARRAEASSQFMSLMLEQIGEEGRPLSPVELVDRSVELLDRQYAGDPRFVAEMLLQLARRYMDLENTDGQHTVLSRAEEIARRLDDDALLAAARCAMAQTLLESNRRDDALRAVAEADGLMAAMPAVPVRVEVDCLRAGAELAQAGGNRAEATALLERARQRLEAADEVRGLQYTAVLTDLGGLRFAAGESREALALNRRVAEVLDRNGRGGTMASVITLSNMGTILLQGGQAAEALETIRESLSRQRALRGDHPPTPASSALLARPLLRLGRHEEAAQALEESVALAAAQGNQFWLAYVHRSLAEAYAGRDPHAAAASVAAARDIWSRDPLTHRDRLRDLLRIEAEIALTAGEPQRARELVDRVLAQAGHPADSSAIGLAAALLTSARIHLEAGDATPAELHALDAVRIATAGAIDAARSADVGEAHWLVARARRLRSNHSGAQEAARRALEPLRAGLGADHALVREVERALGPSAG